MKANPADAVKQRTVSFDMACNQTGSAENKITERSSLYNNLLTFMGEKGASINSNLQKKDPPGLSKLEAPDLLETFKHISNVQMRIERRIHGEV